jgi:hypothetical protein
MSKENYKGIAVFATHSQPKWCKREIIQSMFKEKGIDVIH